MNIEKKIKGQLDNFSKKLVLLRESQKNRDGTTWTQRDVALKLNLSYQSYQAYERGKAYPTLENFLKLAEIFGVSLDYLIAD